MSESKEIKEVKVRRNSKRKEKLSSKRQGIFEEFERREKKFDKVEKETDLIIYQLVLHSIINYTQF